MLEAVTSRRRWRGLVCSACNEVLIAQTVIPANGHTEMTLPGKEATEFETGLTKGKQCSVCGLITQEQQTLPKKDHVHVYAATVVDGVLYESCFCGDQKPATWAILEGNTLTVTLLHKMYPTLVYATRYDDDNRLVEVHYSEVT